MAAEIGMRLEYRPVDLTKPSSTCLREFRNDVMSQNGEDGVIAKLFDLIGTTNKLCIEFGAWDGKLYSNTWALIHRANWSGILIEGASDRFRDLESTYATNDTIKLLNRYVGFGRDSLDNILREVNCPTEPDFVSIDIDGMDWHVWASLEEFKPRLIVIEFNPTIPNDVFFVQARDPKINQGCSLLALIELGKRKGYELAATTVLNAFFVRSELFSRVGIADNSIGAMHNPAPYETKLFQLYDGVLVVAGYASLMWSGVPIFQWMVQPLPKRHRRFPSRIRPFSLSSRIRYRLAKVARDII